MSSRLILQHKFAMGDTVLLTALCRDIHLAYPGRFDLQVDTHCREIFDHNPHAEVLSRYYNPKIKQPASRRIKISYRAGITAAGKGRKIHMLSWYHKDFSDQMGLVVPVTQPKGELFLTAAELVPRVPGRYWVVLAGGKRDATTKIWRHDRWQQTVDALGRLGIICVQTGATDPNSIHKPLTGVVDMLGKCKGARELAGLIANADGVICPITGAMHLAACFDKPCVVVAGGREEPWWEGYDNLHHTFGASCPPVTVPHRYLHTIGLLDCCKTKGCWKHRTVALGIKDAWDDPKRRCVLPVLDAAGIAAPACMDLLTPDQVVSAVLSYYTDGTLPAIGSPRSGTPVRPSPPLQRMPEPVADAAPDRIVLPTLADYMAKSKSRLTSRPADPELIDHPVLGGKLTVCVLCYGDYYDLARSCFDSIVSTLPATRMDLRVGLNAVCAKTRELVKSLPVTRIYDHPENAKKYPVQREMFHDPDCPLATPYVVWFDDDARVVDQGMWSSLCSAIVNNHSQGCRLYGWPMSCNLQQFARNGHDPYAWFKTAPWWKGKPFYLHGSNREAVNGSSVRFCPGWFWAIARETIIKADIPDKRLAHNGGDVVIGSQVQQAGGLIKNFNEHKTAVWCPPREAGGRRGHADKFFPFQQSV